MLTVKLIGLIVLFLSDLILVYGFLKYASVNRETETKIDDVAKNQMWMGGLGQLIGTITLLMTHFYKDFSFSIYSTVDLFLFISCVFFLFISIISFFIYRFVHRVFEGKAKNHYFYQVSTRSFGTVFVGLISGAICFQVFLILVNFKTLFF